MDTDTQTAYTTQSPSDLQALASESRHLVAAPSFQAQGDLPAPSWVNFRQSGASVPADGHPKSVLKPQPYHSGTARHLDASQGHAQRFAAHLSEHYPWLLDNADPLHDIDLLPLAQQSEQGQTHHRGFGQHQDWSGATAQGTSQQQSARHQNLSSGHPVSRQPPVVQNTPSEQYAATQPRVAQEELAALQELGKKCVRIIQNVPLSSMEPQEKANALALLGNVLLTLCSPDVATESEHAGKWLVNFNRNLRARLRFNANAAESGQRFTLITCRDLVRGPQQLDAPGNEADTGRGATGHGTFGQVQQGVVQQESFIQQASAEGVLHQRHLTQQPHTPYAHTSQDHIQQPSTQQAHTQSPSAQKAHSQQIPASGHTPNPQAMINNMSIAGGDNMTEVKLTPSDWSPLPTNFAQTVACHINGVDEVSHQNVVHKFQNEDGDDNMDVDDTADDGVEMEGGSLLGHPGSSVDENS